MTTVEINDPVEYFYRRWMWYQLSPDKRNVFIEDLPIDRDQFEQFKSRRQFYGPAFGQGKAIATEADRTFRRLAEQFKWRSWKDAVEKTFDADLDDYWLDSGHDNDGYYHAEPKPSNQFLEGRLRRRPSGSDEHRETRKIPFSMRVEKIA